MIRSVRIRRLFAPTVGLGKAVAATLLGGVALLIGIGLSFKSIINPALVAMSSMIRNGMMQFVPEAEVDVAAHYLGLVCLLLGAFLFYRGTRFGMNHVIEILNPELKSSKVDTYLRRQYLARGPRIVAIGGGTGLSTLLRGLKQRTSNITAVVCVTDDGGSSGKLAKDMGLIPPGDIRNCLVALAEAEGSMTDLFQHRFQKDSGSLSGHAIGNLLIAALVIQSDGDFEKAIDKASDVLNIRGRVVPATLDHVKLRAIMEGGSEVVGETAIVNAKQRIQRLFLEPAVCSPADEAIEAMANADLICIGPGSVFTSVIPNLLVPGIAEAIRDSKAIKAYVCNVMTQPGETDDFTASGHVRAILDNVSPRVFDYVLINNASPSETSVARYLEFGQHVVEPDAETVRAFGFRVILADLMSETEVVRHEPTKVVAKLMSLLGE